MTETLIELKNLKKVFITEDVETTALNDINLQVAEGEFVALMGPSGCGKSTLLNILGMLDQPSSGDYLFLGDNITKRSERGLSQLRKSHLGFIFQSFNLIDELTVGENVELPLIYQKVPASERAKRVEAVLQEVDMGHRSSHLPQQLSGGQQQRVAVARALVARPKVILADEPTGNLDTKNGHEVMTLLKDLNKEGATIVMVTHSQEFADWAQRTVRLLDGQVVTEEQGQGDAA